MCPAISQQLKQTISGFWRREITNSHENVRVLLEKGFLEEKLVYKGLTVKYKQYKSKSLSDNFLFNLMAPVFLIFHMIVLSLPKT
jgi:hypothetical protein